MGIAIKKMGIYRALNSSAIQFNSAVFRCVVGVLANVPPSTVAIITTIEFCLNFILEIPTGRIADRYGRVPCAIIGHIAVILGLSCGYTALILGGRGSIPELLFILHGVLIGITTPLVSGSLGAFYQDAVTREEELGLHEDAQYSFTLSGAFGKYFTTIAIIVAFIFVYILHQFEMSHHAFIPGIILWGGALYRLALDYRGLGDRYSLPSSMSHIVKLFKNRRVLTAMLHHASAYLFVAIIAGYLIISIGREFEGRISEFQSWLLMFLFFFFFPGNHRDCQRPFTSQYYKKIVHKNLYINILPICPGFKCSFPCTY